MVGHNNGGANSAAVRTETVKMCEAVWTEAKVTLRIQVVSTTLGRPELPPRWDKVEKIGKKHISPNKPSRSHPTRYISRKE